MIEEQKVIKGQKAVLREKRASDADNDYAWRCDPELSRYDATVPLKLSFREYMLYYTEQLQNPKEGRRWFAIDSLEGKHIGNCMYYDVDESRKHAKIGIIIGEREYWGKGYGADALNSLVSYIFAETDLDRVYLDTLDWNKRAQRCFQKCGFVVCGRLSKKGSNFVIMELHRSWLKPDKGEPHSANSSKFHDAT
jgi:RimJ/RimL family protein N-acetyltransferase